MLAIMSVAGTQLAEAAFAQGAHLFILSGQSNMNGLNPGDTFIPAVEQRFGAEDVIVVKDSHGGQPIRRWDKGWKSDDPKKQGPIGDLYDQLMTKVNAAIADREIQTVTFLWMQGEKDAREKNADVYRESFLRLLDQLRKDLDHPNVNSIIGRLSDFGNKNPNYPDWNKMRRVLVELADSSKRSAWVNTDDLNDGKNRKGKVIKDDLHYSVEGYREFGRRLAQAAIERLQRTDLPYDIVPAATEGYHRVRYEASTEPGKLQYPVQYTVWIPKNVKTLRGLIVHQHGCGTGSCRSGLTGAFDLHWQALAAKHDCAFLAASYEQPFESDCAKWCDPRNGSDEAFQNSLRDLAKLSGHAELATVPWAVWGHSGGGYWTGIMLMTHPERFAAAWMQSGAPFLEPDADYPDSTPVALPDQPIQAAVMLNVGTEEGFTVKEGRFKHVWPRAKNVFSALREKGTPATITVDPLTGHECGEQRYLAIPWFDACLSARLPAQPGEPMKPISTESGWFAPLMQEPSTESTASASGDYTGGQSQAIWLPNEDVANVWMQFIRGERIKDSTPPPAPTNVKLSGGQLTWRPVADVQSGILHFVIRRDGEVIGQVPDSTANSFGRPLAQGLLYSDTPTLPLKQFTFHDTTAESTSKHQYSVTTVNTVGLESEPTKATETSPE
ncbi:MAG: hypothetical protein Aurels2KO_11850 [Aureliella sp.]